MMPRLLLLVGLVVLTIALAMTGALSVLRVDEVVEIFPVPPEALDLPLPTGAAPLIAAPASTPAPIGPVSDSSGAKAAILQSGHDNYCGCSDTYIQFYRPAKNYSQSPEISLATSNKAATLLRFDLTELPDSTAGLNSDAAILEAKLELYAVQGNPDTVMGIYLPRRSWNLCAITWNAPWETPGADGISDREQDPWVEVTAKQATGWMQFDITGLVQYWLRDPAQNHGMIIKSLDVSTPSHYIFLSSDHPDESERPRLTIRYKPAAQMQTPVVTPASMSTPATMATPTLISPLSPRVVEVHWRNEMDIGGSYPVRVIFRPETAQATMGRPSPETRGDSAPGLSERSPMGLYMLSVQAQMTAPTFEIVENSPAVLMLEKPEDTLSWSWQVEPQVLGSQMLSLDLLFDWRPAVSSAPATGAEPGAWYQTKVINVIRPFRYWSHVTVLRSLLALIGLACVAGWYLLRRQTRGKSLGD